MNLDPLVKKVKKKLDFWLVRDLSLNGRVLLSKSEGLSRLIYPAMVMDVPQEYITQIDRKMFDFIWKNKPHYLKKNVLCNSYSEGGLNALDFGTANMVFKINWFKRYIKEKDKLWFIIPELLFRKVGGIEFLLHCNYDVGKIPVNLSNFHKQALMSWLMIYKHGFSPHRSLIWNNKK